MTDKLTELKDIYGKIFSLQIEGHRKAIPLAFHQTMSPLTHLFFYDGKDTRYARFHLFMVWASGTGKGELMRLTKDILTTISQKHKCLCTSGELNPTTLRGGAENRPKEKGKGTERVTVKGLLDTHKYIAWGEANSLLSSSSQYANAAAMQNLILNVTDDPGVVTYTARKDLSVDGDAPSYVTYANLATGTTPNIKALNTDLLRRGFLSRFLFDYEPDDDEQGKKLFQYIAGRASASEDRDRFNDLVMELKNTIYSHEYKNKVSISKAVSNEYKIYKTEQQELGGLPVWDKIALDTYGTTKEIMRAYHYRSIINDKRIAAQCASINGQSEVDFEYLKYGADVTLQCLDSLGQFLSANLHHGNETSVQATEGRTVVQALKNGPMNQSLLINHLLSMRALGTWSKGRNATNRALIQLCKEGLIKREKTGTKNAWVYKLGRTPARAGRWKS